MIFNSMVVVTYRRLPKTWNLFLIKSSWFHTIESKTKSRKWIFSLAFNFHSLGKKNVHLTDKRKREITRVFFPLCSRSCLEEGIATRSDSHVFATVKAGKYPTPRETLTEFEEPDLFHFVWKIFQNMHCVTHNLVS